MQDETTPQRVLVLWFDGTGNTFRPNGAETNIRKFFECWIAITTSNVCLLLYQLISQILKFDGRVI